MISTEVIGRRVSTRAPLPANGCNESAKDIGLIRRVTSRNSGDVKSERPVLEGNLFTDQTAAGV